MHYPELKKMSDSKYRGSWFWGIFLMLAGSAVFTGPDWQYAAFGVFLGLGGFCTLPPIVRWCAGAEGENGNNPSCRR